MRNAAAASDNGWEKKAALLTGSPGIGKTTMAHLVCHELGYEVWTLCWMQSLIDTVQIVELNASDARSKSTLENTLATLLGNTTMTQFFGSKTMRKQVRHYVIRTVYLTSYVGRDHGRS